MSKKEDIALFDDYLRNDLSADERQSFEERLAKDPDLNDQFQQYKLEFSALRDAGEYEKILTDLDQIHDSLYGNKKKVFYLRAGFYVPVSVAACLAIALWIVNPFENAESADVANNDDWYEELGADTVEKTEVGEEAPADFEEDSDFGYQLSHHEDSTTLAHFTNPDSLIDLVRGRPIGTGFMISNKGYFLTAKHLLKKRSKVRLQHKDLGFTFYARKVYVDSFLDFAILKCDERVTHLFKSVPYTFYREDAQLGQDVFTLGYPKIDIVYTKGAVGSETGFQSDSNYFEISMPANKGNSGAPLFTEKGELIGIIAANHKKKQSVTYVLKHTYIKDKIDELVEKDSLDIDMRSNKLRRYSSRASMIDAFRPFVFEVHTYK